MLVINSQSDNINGMKDVTVVIAGRNSQGKSSIAKILHDALIEKGVKVRLFDHVHDEYAALEEQPKLQAEDEDMNVLVKVVTTTRTLDLVSE